MTLSPVAAPFLGLSFTLDGGEHAVNNHTKTAVAKQVKYVVAIIVGLGQLPTRRDKTLGGQVEFTKK